MLTTELIEDLQGQGREVGVAILYRKGNEVLRVKSHGTRGQVGRDLTGIFAEAEEKKADAIIFAHNHPCNSGPSMEDQLTANQAKDMAEGRGIKWLGSWVITKTGAKRAEIT
jgi:DNA repair protein RadC